MPLRKYDAIVGTAGRRGGPPVRATLAMLALLAAGTAQAQVFYDGNRIWQICTMPNARGFLLGFVSGMADTQIVYRGMLGNPPPDNAYKVCLPSDVTNEQLADIMCTFLKDHPQERHLVAVSTTLFHLSTLYPCPTN